MRFRIAQTFVLIVATSFLAAGCPGPQNQDPDAGSGDPTDGGGSGLCVAGATEDCDCGALAGTRTCADDGASWGECICAPACTASALTAAGDVDVEGRLLDVSGAVVETQAAYAPSGCVSDAAFTVRLSDGCSLELAFGPYAGAEGGLLEVVLTSLSCPGLPTGTYRSPAGHGAWWWRGPRDMPLDAPAGACLENAVVTFPAHPVRLTSESSGAEITLHLDDLILAGEWFATPDETAACVETVCAYGLHDGGRGWCLPEGKCAVGYQDGGDGSCVPEGTCADGYHDDGAGGCLPPGECAAGRHDDGTGTCVSEGCAEGFREAADGTCTALVPCSAGVSVAPKRLDFSSLLLGESRVLSFDVTNPAEFDPCTLKKISLGTGTADAYALAAGTETGVELAPGQTHVVEVSFAPTAAGDARGFVAVQLDDGIGNIEMIRLVGRGSDVQVVITPENVDFGVGITGCAPVARQVCVANTGTDPFVLDAARIDPTEAFGFDPPAVLPAVVHAGSSLCLDVAFVPPSQGNYVATLTLTLGSDSFPLTLYGVGQGPATATETFVQTDGAKADLLFVVDNSGSMQEKQLRLSQEATPLVDALTAAGVDYHLGVVSTDTGDGGSLLTAAATGPAWVDASAADPAAELAANIELGTMGSATEAGLESAYLALTEPALSGPNAGFIRQDAYLALIFLSDEEDQSPQPISFYESAFQSVHGPGRLLAAAIVGLPATTCNLVVDPGLRYIQVVTSLGGTSLSPCDADWSPATSGLVPTMTELPRLFELSGAVEPGTVSVEVLRADGTVWVPVDWVYDPALGRIEFTGEVPAPGDTIDVSYTVACEGSP